MFVNCGLGYSGLNPKHRKLNLVGLRVQKDGCQSRQVANDESRWSRVASNVDTMLDMFRKHLCLAVRDRLKELASHFINVTHASTARRPAGTLAVIKTNLKSVAFNRRYSYEVSSLAATVIIDEHLEIRVSKQTKILGADAP